MQKLICSLFLVFASAVFAGEATFPSVPKDFFRATHRISGSRTENGYKNTGHGACVSVDLSEYGLTGTRFILTAAHCVQDNGKVRDILIEVDDKKYGKTWISATVIMFDTKADIALLIVDQDMPQTFKLAAANPEMGDPLITIGSPQGTVLTANAGFMSDNQTDHLFQASMSITHGNSGGPIFDPNNKLIVGILVAASAELDEHEQQTGLTAPNITLFSAVSQIRKFLDDNLEKIKKKLK